MLLLRCVDTIIRVVHVHNLYIWQSYMTDARRYRCACVGEHKEQQHDPHDVLAKLI